MDFREFNNLDLNSGSEWSVSVALRKDQCDFSKELLRLSAERNSILTRCAGQELLSFVEAFKLNRYFEQLASTAYCSSPNVSSSEFHYRDVHSSCQESINIIYQDITDFLNGRSIRCTISAAFHFQDKYFNSFGTTVTEAGIEKQKYGLNDSFQESGEGAEHLASMAFQIAELVSGLDICSDIGGRVFLDSNSERNPIFSDLETDESCESMGRATNHRD
ncbi:MAG: hypothetical protein IPM48_07970 [Saprospiraceae bacterium]|nr:hypothetical protein [Saprospiraceae bacterium]